MSDYTFPCPFANCRSAMAIRPGWEDNRRRLVLCLACQRYFVVQVAGRGVDYVVRYGLVSWLDGHYESKPAVKTEGA